MGNDTVVLEISEILGYFDLSGEDAMTSEQVEKLEYLVSKCNEASSQGSAIVVDAIYDRMVEVLKILNPDSPLLREVWGEDVVTEAEMESDIHRLVKKEPMRSIQTCKSYDCSEVLTFVSKLPDDTEFDLHASVKLNGHGIRLVYNYGYLEKAFSRARHTAGRDLTRQVQQIAERDGYLNIEALSDYEQVEIRGELLLPLANLSRAREFNTEIVSAFSGVASMSKESASEEEIDLLDFVGYKIVADDFYFAKKSDMYDMLDSWGVKTPMNWVIDGVTKDTVLEQLPQIIEDCESCVLEDGQCVYDYFTDGIVVEVNDTDLFNAMGYNGDKYYYGNIALKVGYWKQDLYNGYIQCILWTQGKNKLSPVAIVAADIDMAEFSENCDDPVYYVKDLKDIINYKDLGVVTAGGNRVRRVPLFEPYNMVLLEAYVGMPIYFRYGGEAGVVPCTADGTPLATAKLKESFSGNDADDGMYSEYDIVE